MIAYNINDQLEGIKSNKTGDWNNAGHPQRVLNISKKELLLFSNLYDDSCKYSEAKLPKLHATPLLSVLEKLANQPEKLSQHADQYISSEMWHETNQQKDGTLLKQTVFPLTSYQWVLSGPHIYVGTPINNTPRKKCNNSQAYDTLDLSEIPENYFPRTNFVPSSTDDKYLSMIPKVPWSKPPKEVTQFFRLAYRGMLSHSGERTLISAIIPPGSSHIHGLQSTTYKSSTLLMKQALMSFSLVGDFFIKTTGRSNLMASWASFPLLNLNNEGKLRVLALSCLTNSYTDLWEDNWSQTFVNQTWSNSSPLLPRDYFLKLSKNWKASNAYISDYTRRQALVEIDVIVSLSIGMSLEELLTIYRIQFWVLIGNEADTWYDQNGRIIFTPDTAKRGIGMPRQKRPSDLKNGTSYGTMINGDYDRAEEGISLGWEDVKDFKAGSTVSKSFMDDTLSDIPVERTIVYQAPFIKPNREEDYRVAWEFFSKTIESTESVTKEESC